MDSLQRQWYSKKESILKQLTDDEVGLINKHTTRIQKVRSEIFWLDEDSRPMVYILDHGFIRMCRTNDDGKRLITEILGPSEIFGMVVPGLAPTESDDYAEIVRDARILAVHADVFHTILEKHSPMMIRLIQIIETRRRAMEKRIYSFLSKDVCARTVELLLDIGQKYGEDCPFAPGIYRDVHLTHQEIADLLGVARPTISGLVSDLIKTDVVRKHKHFLCLHDVDKMKAVAELGFKGLELSKSK